MDVDDTAASARAGLDTNGNAHKPRQVPPIFTRPKFNVANKDHLLYMLQRIEQALYKSEGFVKFAIEADAHALNSVIPRIIRANAKHQWETEHFMHVLEFGENPKYSLSCHKEGASEEKSPLYSAAAKLRSLSLTSEIRVDALYKCYKRGRSKNGKDVVWQLKSIDRSMLLINYDYSQVGGIADRTALSGMFCHEDPNDQGGYYIVDGIPRSLVNSLDTRPNFPFVYFKKKSSNTTSPDNINLIQCDLRSFDEAVFKMCSCVHMYLAVADKKTHMKFVEQLRARQSSMTETFGVNEFSTFEDVMPTTSKAEFQRLSNMFNMVPSAVRGTSGVDGDSSTCSSSSSSSPYITVALQNIGALNFNLVAFLFLMGVHRRSDMMKLIVPSLNGIWPDDDDETVDKHEHPLETIAKHPLIDDTQLAMARLAFGLIYRQGVLAHIRRTPKPPAAIVDHVRQNFPLIDAAGNPIDDTRHTLDGGWTRAMVFAHIVGVVSGEKKGGSVGGGSSSTTIDSDEAAFADAQAKQRVANNPALAFAVPLHKKHQMEQFKKTPWLAAFERLKRSMLNENMPHLGVDNSWKVTCAKRTMLGVMVSKMICFFLDMLVDEDVDSMSSRRIAVGAGRVKAALFKMSFEQALFSLKEALSKKSEESKPFVFKALAEKLFEKSFAAIVQKVMTTGKWPSTGASVEVTGVSEVLKFITPAANMEQIRCVKNTSLAPQSKEEAVHGLRGDVEGFLCYEHTPPDERAGIVCYLAKGAHVRVGYERRELEAVIVHMKRHAIVPLEVVKSMLGDERLRPMGEAFRRECIVVMINDQPVGYTRTPQLTLDRLRESRRTCIPGDLGITWVGGPRYPGGPLVCPYFNYINISGDNGGVHRPMLRLDQIWKLPKAFHRYGYSSEMLWSCMINWNIVEFLDAEEIKHNVTTLVSALDLLKNETAKAAWFNPPSSSVRAAAVESLKSNMPTLNDFLALERGDDKVGGAYKLSDHIRFTQCLPLPMRHSATTLAMPTHMGISGELATGLLAGLVPYMNTSNSARITIGIPMKEQIIPEDPLNVEYRKKPSTLNLMIGQKTMSATTVNDAISIGRTGAGTVRKFVGILCDAFTAEDGTKHVRLDFGQGTFVHRTTTATKVKAKSSAFGTMTSPSMPSGRVGAGKECAVFEKPDVNTTLGQKSKDYSALKDDGTPMIGAIVPSGGATVGRTFVDTAYASASASGGTAAGGKKKATASTGRGPVVIKRDKSEVNSTKLPQVIRQVVETTGGRNGSSIVLVYAETMRMQDVGNKGATHPGQKGVSTCAYPPENMPYIIDRHGRRIVFDMLMNPPGMAGRATVSQPKESQQARIDLDVTGEFCLVDTWHGLSMTEQMEILYEAGFDPKGTEIVYSGETGEAMQSRVFCGYVDYQYLHHLALEKFKSRNTGGVDAVTKQPIGGGSREGGGKSGFMELLDLNAQGATFVHNQSLNTGSDPAKMKTCLKCGTMVNKDQCGKCGTWHSVVEVSSTSTTQLTLNEIGVQGTTWRTPLSKPLNHRLAMGEDEMIEEIMTREVEAFAKTSLPLLMENDDGDVRCVTSPPYSPSYSPPYEPMGFD
jgi:DNA-directed RNA polymerase beta subunit